MAMAKVDFQIEPADNPSVTSDIRKRFLSVTDVASWRLVEATGKVLYTGLIVMGPKALPDGGFQSFAELVLDLPADPSKAIPSNAIPAIENAVLTEYRKRAVFISQPGTETKQ